MCFPPTDIIGIIFTQAVGIMKKYFGYFAVLLGVLIFLTVTYINSQIGNTPKPFSPNTIIISSWEKYKKQFINTDGRVIDYTQNSLTTSEGQSYALLRSVWVDDKQTFDLVWKWTFQNLKRPEDNLFGWKWGQKNDRTFGFLENGGNNTATDADADIALALILANRRWHQPVYLDAAKKIIPDIWKTDTATTSTGVRYLIAGNWAQNSDRLIINPSYFSPYAWRIFAEVDTHNPWGDLITPAYNLLNQSTHTSSGLPPDWVMVNRHNGDLVTPDLPNLGTDYYFDAMRVPWRIYIDYQWNNEERARQFLVGHFQKLLYDYQTTNQLSTKYRHDGTPLTTQESPVMYATALSYFQVTNPALATKIYTQKILSLYSNDTNSFDAKLPYYDQNWLWFAVANYNNYLIPFDQSG
ncbi:hypothetical protein HY310_00435 [Candidatus Microgenomates bacterium]|nr:hypothetical protein [Candidatus Microgenomates bacterium]